jgi:hypothetical protein
MSVPETPPLIPFGRGSRFSWSICCSCVADRADGPSLSSSDWLTTDSFRRHRNPMQRCELSAQVRQETSSVSLHQPQAPPRMRGFFFEGRSARRLGGLCARIGHGVAPEQHLAFFAGTESRARIHPEAESILAVAGGHGENCMGEILLLLSCGAAFLTGLGIAAASLFG